MKVLSIHLRFLLRLLPDWLKAIVPEFNGVGRLDVEVGLEDDDASGIIVKLSKKRTVNRTVQEAIALGELSLKPGIHCAIKVTTIKPTDPLDRTAP